VPSDSNNSCDYITRVKDYAKEHPDKKLDAELAELFNPQVISEIVCYATDPGWKIVVDAIEVLEKGKIK
jgi:hypothetical protein